MAVTKLNINGAVRSVDVPADMPLLWVLRDVLDLTGSKYGCGIGVCGACAVLIDGEARRSCMVTASEVGTGKVVTIEGISKDGSHPLQKAWIEHDVPQCGYCQAGQIIAAAALLKATPRPTKADLDLAMGGHICRCGTYQRIQEAILAVASAAPVAVKPTAKKPAAKPASKPVKPAKKSGGKVMA